MADVFLSYSRRDGEFIARLNEALAAAGKEVWLDADDIGPATGWRDEIAAGIDAASAFAFVISPASLESSHCADELAHAVTHGKRIVPVLRTEPNGATVPTELADRQYVFLRDGDVFDRGIANLVAAIDALPEWTRMHTQVLERAAEWKRRGEERGALMRGRALTDAERWLTEGAAEREPQPTDLQREFVRASRSWETRRQRIVLLGVATALVVASVLALVAWLQRNEARHQAHVANSRALATQANAAVARRPELAALLAVEAARAEPTFEARAAAIRVMQRLDHTRVILRHPAAVSAVATSPDGRTLATGAADGAIRLFDAATGRSSGTPLTGHRGSVNALAFDPESGVLASGGDDHTIRLWNVAQRKQIGAVLGRDPDAVNSVDFTSDGAYLASTTTDTFTIWDVAAREQFDRLTLDGSTVGAARFSPSGLLLAVPQLEVGGSGDADTLEEQLDAALANAQASVLLYDLEAGGSPVALPSGRFASGDIAFSRDGTRLAEANLDGTVRVYDVASLQVVRGPFKAHRGGVGAVAFAGDAETLVTGGDEDFTVKRWNLSGEKPTSEQLGAHAELVADAATVLGGRAVATAGGDGTVRVWDLAGNRLATRFVLTAGEGVTAVAISPDGSLVATGTRDGEVAVSRSTGVPVRLNGLNTGGAAVHSLAFRDGGVVVSVDDDGVLRAWKIADASGGEPLQLARPTKLSADGRRALVWAGKGRIVLWDLLARRSTGTELADATGLPFALALSPDGRLAAAGGEEGLRLWRLPGGEPVGDALPFYTHSLAFSPDSSLLAVGGPNDVIQLIDTETGSPLAPLPLHRESAFGVAFGKEGKTLAAIFNDGSVGLWDVPLRRPLTDPLRGAHAFGLELAFDEAHGVLVSTGQDDSGGSAVLWSPLLWSEARTDVLTDRLCAAAGRNMTVAEWRELVGSASPRRTCEQWPAPD